MNTEIFRKKSLDRIKSPENLDDCIQVSNPGVWLLLVSVIILLAGACIWSVFGHIDSTVDTEVYIEDGTVICRIAETDISSIREGMTVKFHDTEAVITEIRQNEDAEYVCVLQPELTVPDGLYEGKVVTAAFKPLSFILN